MVELNEIFGTNYQVTQEGIQRQNFGECPVYLKPEYWMRKDGGAQELGETPDECIINYLRELFRLLENKSKESGSNQPTAEFNCLVLDNLALAKYLIFYFWQPVTLWAVALVSRSPLADYWWFLKIAKYFLPPPQESQSEKQLCLNALVLKYWQELPIITDILPLATDIICPQKPDFDSMRQGIKHYCERLMTIYSRPGFFEADIARFQLAQVGKVFAGGIDFFSIPEE